MKRRDLLTLAAASAAGLLLPSWLTAASARKILVPGFTPTALAEPERKATLQEVQALIRRWQRGKDERGQHWLPGKVGSLPVTLGDIEAMDASTNYAEYLESTGRKSRPDPGIKLILLPDGGSLGVTSDGRE